MEIAILARVSKIITKLKSCTGLNTSLCGDTSARIQPFRELAVADDFTFGLIGIIKTAIRFL